MINHILEHIRKTEGCLKDKVVSHFKINTPGEYGKQTVYRKRKKLIKLKIQKQSEDNIIKNIRSLFKIKKENEAIKGRIIWDIRTFFEQEDDYCKTVIFGTTSN